MANREKLLIWINIVCEITDSEKTIILVFDTQHNTWSSLFVILP